MRLRRMWAALGLALWATAAAAQEDYGRTGAYLAVEGATVVYTQLDDELGTVPAQTFPPAPPDTVDIEAGPALGVHARAGYRFLPRFAAEAHLEYLPGSKIFAPTHRFETTITDLSVLTLTADFKGYLTTGMVQPYLLAGVGWMRTWDQDTRKNPATFKPVGQNPDNLIPMVDPISTEGRGAVGRFGGGLDFYVTRSVSIGAGAAYVLPLGNWGDFDYHYLSMSWGLQYRF